MFERIKNIISGIGYAIKYSDVIRNVTTAWAKYPGVEDSQALRLWLRPLLTDAASLALLTKTSVDDLVVQAAVKILDNNHAWVVVHGMVLLIQDGIGEHAVPSRMELPLRCNNPLPLVAGVDERNNVERIIETEGYCGEAACFPGENGDVFEMSRRVAGETMPECPAAVISAIGVILFLLQSRQRNPSFRALK